mgnify:FL=1|tara:strand:+ start:1970 stop:2197 length:228 start_codon:yes stop_codon:yes gene_type:complete
MFLLNLDERYHSYLDGKKKLRIDGKEHRVKAYGYTDDGQTIDGYYLTTEDHTLYYNKEAQFLRMESLDKVAQKVA